MSRNILRGRNKALVVGATGIIGSAIVRRLAASDGWASIGVSRSGGPIEGVEQTIAVDLTDVADCERKLGGLSDITHIFYAAYQARPSRQDEVGPNLAMLQNVVNTVSANSTLMRKVVLVTGAKFYGIQWGPVKTPMRETDPRQMPPNFYYDQEDFLRTAGHGSNWHWCNLIPPFVSGFSLGNPMNLVMAVGVFAVISRELNIPLRFPGLDGAFRSLHQLADADQIATAAMWAALEPNANDERFNVANGDPMRWQNFWPALAGHFGMGYADPKTLPLARMMTDNEDLWARMVGKYQLRSTRITRLVDWNWADYMFRMAYDVVMETGKIRRAGFHDSLDTAETFIGRLRQLQEQRIIPY